jgi:uncharacterized DUF497 family protein
LEITGIIWLDDIVAKLAWKHRVQQQEVREVLSGPVQFRFAEKGHRSDENVYAGFDQTAAGRYLVVFFVYKKDRRALVISAREMTKAERRNYEKG